MELRQKDVAGQIWVSVDTIRNWGVGRASPAPWQWPRIIRFLGLLPLFRKRGFITRRRPA